MAGVYPESPYVGQQIIVGGTKKQWDGQKWVNVTHGNHELRIQSVESSLLADLVAIPPPVGTYRKVSDRYGAVVKVLPAGVTADGYMLVGTSSGTVLEVQPDQDGKIIVTHAGAKGDDSNDDGPAINSCFNYARANTATNSGWHVHFPRGTFRTSETLDYYTPVATGILITGAGYNVTVVKWMGTAGALFSNEQPVPADTAYKFQYGFNMRDMSLTTNGAARPAGSVGLHVEMLQNKAEVRNVVIFGFDMGAFIGIHAEMLTVSNSYISYNRIGLWGQGDQVDVLTLRSVTFSYNVERALLLSCPRPNIIHCHFNEGQISDHSIYRDIQVGYSKIRPQDVGKSSYATANKGNDGSRARFINNSFEGLGSKAAVLFENFDARVGIGGGNITFENNKAGLYDRPAFLEVVNPYFNVKFSGTQISSTNPNTCLINDPNAITGSYIIDEAGIGKVWADLTQYLRNGMTQDYYNRLPQLACDLQHSSDWVFSRSDDGIAKINLDSDGEGTIAIDYDQTLFTGAPSIQIQNTNCPAGFLYVNLPFSKVGTNLGVEIEVKNGSGVVLYYNKLLNLSSSTKNKCFAFDNPTTQSLTIRIFPKPYAGDVGSFSIRRPTVKHFNNEAESWFLEDTRRGVFFTRRNNQMFELAHKIQYAEVYDYTNLENGSMFCDKVNITTLASSYNTGVTSFNVVDASALAVGMFIHFKPVSSGGVSKPHYGSLTGNKITSISGNTVTIGTGLPFNVSSGDSVVACNIFRKALATKL